MSSLCPDGLLIWLQAGHIPHTSWFDAVVKATRALAPRFTHATGVDPSEGMISTAKSMSSESSNITYRTGTSTSLPFLSPESVDLVVAGQAAHWFPQPSSFHHLHRRVRSGGVIAFFGYGDCEFPDYPKATSIVNEYSCDETEKRGRLGMYWSQPGRSIVQGLLREVVPPTETTFSEAAVKQKDDGVDDRSQELGEDEAEVCGRTCRDRNIIQDVPQKTKPREETRAALCCDGACV